MIVLLMIMSVMLGMILMVYGIAGYGEPRLRTVSIIAGILLVLLSIFICFTG